MYLLALPLVNLVYTSILLYTLAHDILRSYLPVDRIQISNYICILHIIELYNCL